MLSGPTRRLVYFNSHPNLADHGGLARFPEPARFAVAVSSQAGSGAAPIAERLAAHLQASARHNAPPWKVFYKTLITKVLEDHHLPIRMAKFLREDANNTLDDVLDELFGLHPSSWVIVQQSIETVLNLARTGNVVLVGWGANVITSQLPNVFHVRLVGSLHQRIARIQRQEHLNRKQAEALVVHQDRGRERYVKRYFNHQLSDTQLYHLTINTDRFSVDEIARLISTTALTRYSPNQEGELKLTQPR